MKVSVIIPAYNQDELIKRCLDSIPKRKDVEIIVVNDGSTDKTKDVLEEYKKNIYSDLVIISYLENKGVSVARNKGMRKAQGEYIVFIDSDDYIYPDVFNDIVDHDLGLVDLVFYNMIDNNNHKYEVNRRSIMGRVGMFKFIKKSFIGTTCFAKGIQYGEDAIFHEKLIAKMPCFKCTDKLMYHYNYPREGSLTNLYQKGNKK